MKLKKIILLFSICGAIILLLLPNLANAEEIEINSTPILSKGKCLGDSMCLNNTFCDLQSLDNFKIQNLKDYCSGKKTCNFVDNIVGMVPGIDFPTPSCMPKLEIGKECYKNEQCLSNFCGVGQGEEKKCMELDTGAGYLKFAPIKPILEIKIPTLQPFTTEGLEKPDAEGNIYFPFIGQYIVGIYKWMLLVAGIVATIMIILGGFTYLTSGGNATRAEEGKERIGAAIFGLILLLGSYLLLYLINPGLVEFRSLKIKIMETGDLENAFESKEPYDGIKKPISNNTYDAMFEEFAACNGIDWRVMKAIAWHESGLNPTATYKNKDNPKGAIGLFQTYTKYCVETLKKKQWDKYCELGIKNPVVNTALVTAGQFNSYSNIIKKTCPSADFKQQIFMLYFGVGNGGGGLKNAIGKYTCDPYKWTTDPTIYKSGSYTWFLDIISVAQAQGSTALFVNVDKSKCPFSNGKTPDSFKF